MRAGLKQDLFLFNFTNPNDPDNCGFFHSVLECQDLPIVNGQCDPYAAVSLQGPSR